MFCWEPHAAYHKLGTDTPFLWTAHVLPFHSLLVVVDSLPQFRAIISECEIWLACLCATLIVLHLCDV